MKRKRLSPKARAAILDAQGNVCAHCKAPGDRWEFDHVIPLWLGGADDASNLEAVHKACHRSKTNTDVRTIAKVKRLIRTLSGERSRARKGPPLRSKPFSAWRGMDGTIRRREP